MSDPARFSAWLHWNERSRCPEADRPGIYLLARFEQVPPAVVNSCDERILLIAETHGQTLVARWYQFHRSAFKQLDGHSGGHTFHRLFANGDDSAVPPWLYVSACGVPTGVEVQPYVQALKARLLTEFEEAYGILPRCNTNGPADGGVSADAGESVIVPSASAAAWTGEPEMRFSRWRPWTERATIEGGEFPGVYALARFDEDPPADVDMLDERVVYFGETCDQSLLGRLWQFNRSAFLAKDGHSGGWTYSVQCADAGERLYVAMLPVRTLIEPQRSAFIRFAERKLLWDYTLRWGRRPSCNSK